VDLTLWKGKRYCFGLSKTTENDGIVVVWWWFVGHRVIICRRGDPYTSSFASVLQAHRSADNCLKSWAGVWHTRISPHIGQSIGLRSELFRTHESGWINIGVPRCSSSIVWCGRAVLLKEHFLQGSVATVCRGQAGKSITLVLQINSTQYTMCQILYTVCPCLKKGPIVFWP